MVLDRGRGDQMDVRRHVDDLVRTLKDQNADVALMRQCLEHLSTILETLGERPAAMSIRKELEDRDECTDQVDDAG